MPFVDPTGVNPGWSDVPQVDFGLVEYVESIPEKQITVTRVSASQGGIALIRAGLMDAVLAAANAPDTPAEVKWAFEKVQDWYIESPAFNYLAQKAGITDAKKKELFSEAAKIQA